MIRIARIKFILGSRISSTMNERRGRGLETKYQGRDSWGWNCEWATTPTTKERTLARETPRIARFAIFTMAGKVSRIYGVVLYGDCNQWQHTSATVNMKGTDFAHVNGIAKQVVDGGVEDSSGTITTTVATRQCSATARSVEGRTVALLNLKKAHTNNGATSLSMMMR